MLKAQAFTTPTLNDKTLYLRDLKNIMAIDLGKSHQPDLFMSPRLQRRDCLHLQRFTRCLVLNGLQ